VNEDEQMTTIIDALSAVRTHSLSVQAIRVLEDAATGEGPPCVVGNLKYVRLRQGRGNGDRWRVYVQSAYNAWTRKFC
jgi:hypothetical protein